MEFLRSSLRRHFVEKPVVILRILYCKLNPAVMLIAIFKAFMHWLEATLLTAESLLTSRSRVFFTCRSRTVLATPPIGGLVRRLRHQWWIQTFG